MRVSIWGNPFESASTAAEFSIAVEQADCAKLTFQDETIETLNNTITAQWQQIDALTRQVAGLNERLQQAENNASGARDEPPPHY